MEYVCGCSLMFVGMLGLALWLGYALWRSRVKKPTTPVPKSPQVQALEAAFGGPQAGTVAARAGSRTVAAPPVRVSLEWVGPGQMLEIVGLQLRSPLVYRTDSRHDPENPEPAAIDLGVPVSPWIAPAQGRELPYWPRYDRLTAEQRRYYLQWLSGQRQQVPRELGYFFLFFYNLERRALIEQKDQGLIFDEVLRLRQLYAATGAFSGSFDTYTGAFLWFLLGMHPALGETKRVRALTESSRSWSDDHLAIVIYTLVSRKQVLAPSVALQVAENLPQSQRSVVTKRVPAQFRELFTKRYQQRFGLGLQIRLSKRLRTITYRPASAALIPLDLTIPDPLGIQSQYAPLAEIWNQCVQDLRKLGTVVAAEGARTLTIPQWEAMPPEIRAGVDHPLTAPFCALVERHAQPDGHSLVPASDMARLFGTADPERPTVTQSRQICQTAGAIGYGVEPDARLTNKAYRNGQPLAVFLQVADDPADPARYQAAAGMLQFGMMVAAADGHVHEAELAAITHHIETAFNLREAELRRLEALQRVLVRQGPDRATLTRLARALAPGQRQAVGQLLLALIVADGIVTDDEQKAVAACYKILGLNPQEIPASLAALGAVATDEAPVTVRPGMPAAAGEAIRPAPASGRLKLDRAAIDAILRDTQEVAQMLAQAMAAGGEDEPVETVSPPALTSGMAVTSVAAIATTTITDETPADVTTTEDVPAKYAAFFAALVARDAWPMEEAESLARQHRVMLAGALEALNEWALEKYQGPLFYEDGERLKIERSLLE